MLPWGPTCGLWPTDAPRRVHWCCVHTAKRAHDGRWPRGMLVVVGCMRDNRACHHAAGVGPGKPVPVGLITTLCRCTATRPALEICWCPPLPGRAGRLQMCGCCGCEGLLLAALPRCGTHICIRLQEFRTKGPGPGPGPGEGPNPSSPGLVGVSHLFLAQRLLFEFCAVLGHVAACLPWPEGSAAVQRASEFAHGTPLSPQPTRDVLSIHTQPLQAGEQKSDVRTCGTLLSIVRAHFRAGTGVQRPPLSLPFLHTPYYWQRTGHCLTVHWEQDCHRTYKYNSCKRMRPTAKPLVGWANVHTR